MEKSENINLKDLCRICSGSGSYNIDLPIPNFLHDNIVEAANWRKTIKQLITEVTGRQIHADDNLPQSICAICISYLKHAVTFRNQAINNELNLLASHDLVRKKIASQDEAEPIPSNRSVDNESENQEIVDNLFNCSVDSIRDNEEDLSNSPLLRLFDYTERSFQEDDTVSDIADLVTVQLPENYKERKCSFCLRRFMMVTTFDSHLAQCVELKLMNFITKFNYFGAMRQQCAISSHEFARRCLFELRKLNKTFSGIETSGRNGSATGTPPTYIETKDLPITLVGDAVRNIDNGIINVQVLQSRSPTPQKILISSKQFRGLHKQFLFNSLWNPISY